MLLMGKDKQSDQSMSTIAEQQREREANEAGEQRGSWGEEGVDPFAFGCLWLYALTPRSLGLL